MFRPGGGRLLLGAAVALIAFAALSLTALAYSTAPDYTASDFATGFPGGPVGPVGLAFDSTGNLWVQDQPSGGLYRIPQSVVASGVAGAVAPYLVGYVPYSPTGLAFDKAGHLWVAQQAGMVSELDTTPGHEGTILQTVFGVTGATGIATDPLTGNLFVTWPGGGPIRVIDPTTSPASIVGLVSINSIDGITFGPDGTLYLAQYGAAVLSAARTPGNGVGPASIVTALPLSDGIAVAANTHNLAHPAYLFANRNNGVITKIELGSPVTTTDVFAGGSRGDFSTVGPDGCLYATQSNSIVKLTNADGTCSLAPVTPADVTSLSYTGDTAVQFGDTAHLSATLYDVSTSAAPPAGQPITFTLDNGGGSCAGTTDASGAASCDVSGLALGSYTVTAAFSATPTLAGAVDTATLAVSEPPPTITLQSITPAPNGAGWNNTSPVTVTWTCTNSQTATVSVVLTSDGANQSAIGTCISDGDPSLTASDTQLVSIDTMAPAVTATASVAPNGAGWNNTPVTVTVTAAADGGSSITCDAPVVVSTDGAGQVASGTCTDAAGNTGSASITLNIDTTAPTLTPSVTPNPVELNGAATADAGAADATSGIDTSSCDPVVTASVGSYTVDCTATDVAGNTATATASYDVGYAVCASESGPSKQTGSTIPAKISLCDASGVNVSSPAITVTAVGLSPAGTLDDSGHANPGDVFRPVDSGYIFNLSTKGLAPGDYTLDFTVAGDPTVHHYAFTVQDHGKH